MQNTPTNVTHIQALWHIVQLLLATDVSSKQKITFCQTILSYLMEVKSISDKLLQ